MGKFAQSWTLAKQSYAVLRRNPSLMAFPVLSAIATVMVSVSFFVPVFIITGGKNLDNIAPSVRYPVAFLFYFITYFVVIFFNSAMVACAHEALSGRETSLSYGLSMAGRRIWAILGWTAIAATVGVALKFLSDRSGLLGKIVVGVIGVGWNIATYFVIPVLVVERAGPIPAVKKSAVMLKQTWGERLIASVGMGAIMGLLVLAGIAGAVGGLVLAAAGGQIALGVGLACMSGLYILMLAVIATAMQGIFQTALYVYAESGAVPNGFDSDSICGAFATKESAVSKLRRRF